ncbi:ornithine cyclodeaminase family protein [Pseudarthrobacter oxydans]|uniref:ornithine cyclodeaminase family protein n=1 Tax=Pseudarthrobacter oxydans TaxID=1671 RepID=UPI003ECD374E
MIYLTEQDVLELLTIDDALAAVDQALTSVSKGTAAVAARSRATLNGLNLNLLGGSIAGCGTGAKIYVTGGGNAKFWILLFDDGGTLLALCEADRIGQLRTGAASGVSARILARQDSQHLALLGTGYQARTQAEAIIAATGITEVAIYGRHQANAESFAAALRAGSGVTVWTVPTVEDAVDNADIVVTMTSATEPLVLAKHLRKGTHYVFAGSNNPGNAEAAPEVLAAMDVLVTDDVEQAKRESGTLLRATGKDAITWADVGTLGDSALGTGQIRTDPDQLTAFVSHGLGTWDTALAQILYTKAQGAGRGIVLPINGAPTEGRR